MPMRAMDNEVLTAVKAFAANAHRSQVRKYSEEPCVNHLFRVMQTVARYSSDQAVLSAAVLHDILEDTDVTGDDLSVFLEAIMGREAAGRTARLVEELTDRFVKHQFPHLNRRTRRQREAARLSEVSPDAQTIKYADIIDNVNDLGTDFNDFAPVFMRECKDILRDMNKGDPNLYRLALDTVDRNLKDYYRRANIRAL